MFRRIASRWLAVIITLHVALGLLYMWATPIFEASDEGWHYAVVRWLAQGYPLPIQNPDRPKSETTWEQEGSQPPLYYWLAAGLTAWVNTDDFTQLFVRNPFSRMGTPGTRHNVNLYQLLPRQLPLAGTALAVTIIRVFSLALSAGTVFATYWVAQKLLPDVNEAFGLLAAALVAFNPMALFINASVNNDNLLMLVNSMALWLLLDLVCPKPLHFWWKMIGLGLILGMAALTKVSGLMLWPITVLGLGWAGYRRGARPWQVIWHLGIIFAIAIAVSGWWFWRNWQLYGELLGTRTMMLVAGQRTINTTLWELITQEWASFYLSYWGIFGVFSIRPSEWVITFFNLITAWSIGGLVWAKARGYWRWTIEIVLGLVLIAVTVGGLINWSLQTMASQGRLMFGTIASISALMAAGLLWPLPSKWRPWASAALAGALAIVAAVVPLIDIAPHYAPPLIAASQLPADLHPVHAVIADGMELIGYTSDEAPIHPGEEQHLTLYWRAVQPMSNNYVVALALLGRELEPLGTLDSWPGAGVTPTSLWKPGMIVADAYDLLVDANAQTPTRLRLSLSAWEDDVLRRLPVRAPGGGVDDAIYLDVGWVVPEDPPAVAPQHSDGSTFETGITLLGWDAAADEGALTLTLYWKTDHPVPNDYTVFVHVLDSQGVQVTQADSPPLAGDWPTSAWVPGQVFADPRVIALPPALSSGCCSVRLGFYDPQDGARLAAYGADGAPWQDNAAVLKDVVKR